LNYFNNGPVAAPKPKVWSPSDCTITILTVAGANDC
jgi:hypothetical protein